MPGLLRFVTRWIARRRHRWLVAMRRRASTGWKAEQIAVRALAKKGYRIVGRNVHLPGGEIDVVAVDGRTLVFVEVKGRIGDTAGRPEDHVDEEKQRRLSRLAAIYVRRHALRGISCRFDVFTVYWPAANSRPLTRHYQHAFQAAL